MDIGEIERVWESEPVEEPDWYETPEEPSEPERVDGAVHALRAAD